MYFVAIIIFYAPEGFLLETFISQCLRSSLSSGAFLFIVFSTSLPYCRRDRKEKSALIPKKREDSANFNHSQPDRIYFRFVIVILQIELVNMLKEFDRKGFICLILKFIGLIFIGICSMAFQF